jgi:hypothetical protein
LWGNKQTTADKQCTISAYNFINNNLLAINQSLKCTIHDTFQNHFNVKGDGDLTIVTTKMLNDAQSTIEIKGGLEILRIHDKPQRCPSSFCMLHTIVGNNIQSKVSAAKLGIWGLKEVLGNRSCLNLKRGASDPNRLGRDKFLSKDNVNSNCHEVLLMGRIVCKSLQINSQLFALQGFVFVEQDCHIFAPEFLRNSGVLQVKGNCNLITAEKFFKL